MTWSGGWLKFYYDANGTPYAVTAYDANLQTESTYLYVTNLQGDVVALIDATNGTVAVSYNYDAWGKLISKSGASSDYALIYQYNPLTYRGYIYDDETGFYYLQSRYYDPTIRRFINADGYVNANGDLVGYNMFAYCSNNPVMGSDPTGKWIVKDIIKAFTKYVTKPVISTVQKALSPLCGTYTKGIGGSLTPTGLIVSGQFGISFDLKGNIAMQGTISCGLTATDSPGASFISYETVTSAPSIDKLNGKSVTAGASVGAVVYGVPLCAGRDVVFFEDAETGKAYFGYSPSMGFGTPGAEAHIQYSNTGTLIYSQINVFDIMLAGCDSIINW